MNEQELRPPPVVIDGQNVAGNERAKEGWQWQLVVDVASFHYEAGSQVHVVIPVWIPKLFLNLLTPIAEVIKFTPTGNADKEGDDKLVLGTAALNDGFIVTNDKKIGKHSRGDLLTREWCASHRVGFRFGEEGYVPLYPTLWNKLT